MDDSAFIFSPTKYFDSLYLKALLYSKYKFRNLATHSSVNANFGFVKISVNVIDGDIFQIIKVSRLHMGVFLHYLFKLWHLNLLLHLYFFTM